MRLAGGSPQADLQPGRFPTDFADYVQPHTYIGFQTEIHLKPRASPQAESHKTREAPYKQSFDQGGCPQAELRPGSVPTRRITTRELAGWLAGGITTREPVLRWAGWLAGGLAGWLRPREAQRGPERRSVDRTSLSCAWLEAPHKQIYNQGGSPQISRTMYNHIHT